MRRAILVLISFWVSTFGLAQTNKTETSPDYKLAFYMHAGPAFFSSTGVLEDKNVNQNFNQTDINNFIFHSETQYPKIEKTKLMANLGLIYNLNQNLALGINYNSNYNYQIEGYKLIENNDAFLQIKYSAATFGAFAKFRYKFLEFELGPVFQKYNLYYSDYSSSYYYYNFLTSYSAESFTTGLGANIQLAIPFAKGKVNGIFGTRYNKYFSSASIPQVNISAKKYYSSFPFTINFPSTIFTFDNFYIFFGIRINFFNKN